MREGSLSREEIPLCIFYVFRNVTHLFSLSTVTPLRRDEAKRENEALELGRVYVDVESVRKNLIQKRFHS